MVRSWANKIKGQFVALLLRNEGADEPPLNLPPKKIAEIDLIKERQIPTYKSLKLTSWVILIPSNHGFTE
mgnify:CR=1 FL=1|jgi:hypothetical protein